MFRSVAFTVRFSMYLVFSSVTFSRASSKFSRVCKGKRNVSRCRLNIFDYMIMTHLLHLMPQLLQIVVMILGLLVGRVIEDQPAGNKGQQNFNKLELDAFLHLLNAQHIAQ